MKWLTKSDYLKYRIHPAYLWLQKHAKDKLPPFDESAQAIVDQGNEVEACARGLYPDAKLVESLFADSVRETESYVSDQVPTIFQASVLTDRRLYARADIMTRNDDGSWNLIEVKSSTKEKNEYLYDLGFQKVAFEESGYRIKQVGLIHINNQYVRRGALNPFKLFTRLDVTNKIEHILPQVKREIIKALEIIAQPECPSDDPAVSRNWYGWRDVYRRLHPEITDSSIYNLTRLKPEQLKALRRLEISEMTDIPRDFDLLPQQSTQLTALKAKEPIIHPVKITNHMRKLRFPLYFFDYETVGPAIPAYDGTRPYAQVPFQYSLHILREPGGELEHREFLASGSENPMPKLLAQMREDIGEEGSVVVWFKGFEGSVNAAMARMYPEYRTFLRGVNKRLYDLMEVFSNFYYSDARFGGSSSIKKVLPVLVPELTYSDLEIQKGDVASRLWHQTAQGKITGAAADKVHADLRVYCGQDTLAMVRIYEFLMDVQVNAPGAQLSLLG